LSINVQELGELLNRVDKYGLETYQKNIVEISLRSMADFFNIGSMKKDKVSILAIEQFLNEKGLTSHVNALKREFPGDSKQTYPFVDILKVFDAVLGEETEVVAQMEQEDIFEEQTITEEKPEDFPVGESLSESFTELEESIDEYVEGSSEELSAPQTEDVADNKEIITEDSSESIKTEEQLIEEVDLPQTENFVESEKSDIIEDKESSELIIDEEISTSPAEPIAENLESGEFSPELSENDSPPIEPDLSSEENLEEFEDSNPVAEQEHSDLIEGQDLVDHEDLIEEVSDKTIEPVKSQYENEINEHVEMSKTENIEIPPDEPTEDILSEIQNDDSMDEDLLGQTTEEEFGSEEYPESEPISDEINKKMDLFPEEQSNDSDNLDSIAENDFDIKEEAIEPKKIDDETVNLDESLNEEQKKTADLENMSTNQIDISELLEHKSMTKIIEVVFDYDMEEFSNSIEQLSSCENKHRALDLLDDLFKNNRVDPSSREADTFKSIIEEYFDRN